MLTLNGELEQAGLIDMTEVGTENGVAFIVGDRTVYVLGLTRHEVRSLVGALGRTIELSVGV
jgi:hypothetical protein